MIKQKSEIEEDISYARKLWHECNQTVSKIDLNKINILLKKVNYSINYQNSHYYNETCLHRACYFGNLEVIKLLLKKNPALTIVDDFYEATALHKGYWQEGVADLLISHGTPINAQDKYNETTLHNACSTGHVDVVKLLLENGADIELRNNGGLTPLHIACFTGGNVEIVKILLAKGSSIIALDNERRNPLHIACYRSNNIDTIRILLENGTDLTIKDIYGKVPTDYVINEEKSQIEEIVELIQLR